MAMKKNTVVVAIIVITIVQIKLRIGCRQCTTPTAIIAVITIPTAIIAGTTPTVIIGSD